VDIPRWQCQKHCKAINDVLSILKHQLCVLCPLLGMVVTVYDGCTVGTTWELLSSLENAGGLSSKSGWWCKSNARRHKHSSPRVLYLPSRLLMNEEPGGCATWRLGRFVFVNQQNTGYESKLSYLTSWTKKSQELEYIYPFNPPTPPCCFPSMLDTPPACQSISTSRDLHKTTPLVPKHTR